LKKFGVLNEHSKKAGRGPTLEGNNRRGVTKNRHGPWREKIVGGEKCPPGKQAKKNQIEKRRARGQVPEREGTNKSKKRWGKTKFAPNGFFSEKGTENVASWPGKEKD